MKTKIIILLGLLVPLIPVFNSISAQPNLKKIFNTKYGNYSLESGSANKTPFNNGIYSTDGSFFAYSKNNSINVNGRDIQFNESVIPIMFNDNNTILVIKNQPQSILDSRAFLYNLSLRTITQTFNIYSQDLFFIDNETIVYSSYKNLKVEINQLNITSGKIKTIYQIIVNDNFPSLLPFFVQNNFLYLDYSFLVGNTVTKTSLQINLHTLETKYNYPKEERADYKFKTKFTSKQLLNIKTLDNTNFFVEFKEGNKVNAGIFNFQTNQLNL